MKGIKTRAADRAFPRKDEAMNLDHSERERIHLASLYVADAVTKTIEGMHAELKSQFNLTGRQLNIAIAKSSIIVMVSCAAAAASADLATRDETPSIVSRLVAKLESALDEAFGL